MGSRVRNFYAEFHGHTLEDLETVHDALRGEATNRRPCVFLSGDSTLDNKYWFRHKADALNGYETILEPPTMKKDVAYWLNKNAVDQSNGDWFALNCAVEESALSDRSNGRLLPQDHFIQDHITEDDTLVVSVGGNDIALKVSPATAMNMMMLTHLTTRSWVESASSCTCGSWSCKTCTFRPPGLSHFLNMFKTQVEDFIERLTSKRKPKRVIVCMLYFPLEISSQPCWADRALSALQYNSNPKKLQAIMTTVFQLATKNVRVPGVDILPFAFFDVLDPKDESDYVARVEPSAKGGEKMACALVPIILSSPTDS